MDTSQNYCQDQQGFEDISIEDSEENEETESNQIIEENFDNRNNAFGYINDFESATPWIYQDTQRRTQLTSTSSIASFCSPYPPPPMAPPTYLQPPSSSFYYSNYQNYPNTNSNSFSHNYPMYKAWYNQVKPEQMVNILNR